MTISIPERTKFAQEQIDNLLNQNKTFCQGIGELAGWGTEIAITKIPQLKFLNNPIAKEFLPRFAESQAEKLCNTFTKNLDSGKYCPVPLTQNQKDIALDLLNGKVDENYIKTCKPEDLKLAAKSVQEFTQSKEYNSITRQTESKVVATINSDDFSDPTPQPETTPQPEDQSKIEEIMQTPQAKQTTTFLDELNAQLPSVNFRLAA